MPGDNYYFIYQYFIGYSNISVHIISCPKNGPKTFTLWHSKLGIRLGTYKIYVKIIKIIYSYILQILIYISNLSKFGEYDSNNNRSDTIHPSSLILREK